MKIKLILEFSSKKIHGIYLIFVILILTLSCVIAQMLYPVPYSMLDYHVSAQGGINVNTQGYIYWNIGMIITGILLIPLILYLHRSYSSTSPKISIISFNFDKLPFDPRWLSFPIWEWDLFISVFIWMIGIFLLMPEPLRSKN